MLDYYNTKRTTCRYND